MIWDYHFAFVLVFGFSFIHAVTAKCYFPGELQGVWATQAAPDVIDAPIGYSMVTIDARQISTWGQCYSKIDDNIILADRSGPHSAPCFRCFRLVVASVNVAALVSGGLETCFSSVEDALKTCPVTERGAAHIVLYKVRSSWGESGLQETQCPFSGIYLFSFEKGERSYRGRRSMRCEQPTSEMSNCPFGFSLSLQYRDCTFEDPRAANWHCLGSWKGLDGQQYTAVLDMYSKEGDGKPKYKCGIYLEDKKSGRVHLSFSQDSTCTNGLISAENGYERYVLHNAPSSPLPASVREKPCRFPSSLRGQWHNTDVQRSSITYRDETSFNTLHMQCVREFGDSERYAVYTRSDCGKWFYTCLLLKRRSANVVEIMFGESKTQSLQDDLCQFKQFGNNSKWITQARTHLEAPTTCPIVGTYKGDLPGAPGYCAQLYSDCTRTDLMFYAIDECNNPSAIYEQREYQCIGQWEENGRVYALTKRRDIHTYECFVGVINSHGVVYMKEAGSSCSRDVKPDDFGMKTTIKEECVQESSRSKVQKVPELKENRDGWRGSTWHQSTREITPARPSWVPSTTRPWKPITGRPRRRSSNASTIGKNSYESLLLVYLSLYFVHKFL